MTGQARRRRRRRRQVLTLIADRAGPGPDPAVHSRPSGHIPHSGTGRAPAPRTTPHASRSCHRSRPGQNLRRPRMHPQSPNSPLVAGHGRGRRPAGHASVRPKTPGGSCSRPWHRSPGTRMSTRRSTVRDGRPAAERVLLPPAMSDGRTSSSAAFMGGGGCPST